MNEIIEKKYSTFLQFKTTADEVGLRRVMECSIKIGKEYIEDESRIFDFVLCVDEVFTNCIFHAYNDGIGEVSVSFMKNDKLIAAEIIDYGIGITEKYLKAIPNPEINLLSDSGRGLYLVKNLADSLFISRGKFCGTKVSFYFGRGDSCC